MNVSTYHLPRAPSAHLPCSRATRHLFDRARKAQDRFYRLRALADVSPGAMRERMAESARRVAIEISLTAFESQTADMVRADADAAERASARRMFNVDARRVGGLRFLKIGRLTLSLSIARNFRPIGA